MRVELQNLRDEIQALALAHGVELVALEWLQGPGRGVLRVYIDRPGSDPRQVPALRGPGATADLCADVSRDVSALLDALDVITLPYDLEVSSPGIERPVQKREDFDRFAGLRARARLRAEREGRTSLEGVLRGTRDLPAGDWAVVIELAEGRQVEVPQRALLRARLVEVRVPPLPRPGKGPSKRRRTGAPAAPSSPSSQQPDHRVNEAPARGRGT